MRSRNALGIGLAVSWLIVPLVGCSTVAETGRKRLMLVTARQENELGVQAYREVLAKEKVSADERMSAIVKRVGSRIAEAANQPDFEWEFTLIESEQVNAFCLPGGKIAVYTGILPYMRNEAGMAVVLGHEVAHAVARHGGERMSQQMSVELIEKALSQGLGDASPSIRKATLAAFGAGATLGVLLPYSRTHELEADQMGLLYTARAGYDPQEAIPFWERMQGAGKDKPPEFLSTHPREENRIEQLREQMPAALEAYKEAPTQYGTGESW